MALSRPRISDLIIAAYLFCAFRLYIWHAETFTHREISAGRELVTDAVLLVLAIGLTSIYAQCIRLLYRVSRGGDVKAAVLHKRAFAVSLVCHVFLVAATAKGLGVEVAWRYFGPVWWFVLGNVVFALLIYAVRRNATLSEAFGLKSPDSP